MKVLCPIRAANACPQTTMSSTLARRCASQLRSSQRLFSTTRTAWNAPRSDNEGTTSFGFRNVPASSKESLVKTVFDSVASSYDVMNDASSLGVHRLWKDNFVGRLDPGRGMKCLDVAGGTGDIGLRILDYAREKYGDRELSVEISDINEHMLEEGKKRIAKTMYYNSP